MSDERTHQDAPGFTLIEILGILAVIAVLAGTLLPFLIRSIDKVVSDQEIANLQSFDTALQQFIMRSNTIPAPATWATNLALQLGIQSSSVATNARNQRRFFLIDPAFQVGTNAVGQLPYSQTDTVSPLPSSPRLMILSSLGRPLTSMVNGVPPNSGDFSTIWNAADSSVPAANLLNGWNGTADDLKIRRINLSGLFVHVILSTNASPASGPNVPKYSVLAESYGGAQIVGTSIIDGYFLKGSVLTLYNANALPDSKQVLIKDAGFVYDQNVWRSSLTGAGLVDGIDVASVVAEFLAANHNPTAPANAQSNIVQTMITFLNGYDAWAGSAGFPAHNSYWTPLNGEQSAMVTAVQALYSNPPTCP